MAYRGQGVYGTSGPMSPTQLILVARLSVRDVLARTDDIVVRSELAKTDKFLAQIQSGLGTVPPNSNIKRSTEA